MAKKQKRIADEKEVVQFLTSVLRGDDAEEMGAKDRIKAAELLGKSYGLFTDKGRPNKNTATEIIDDIPKEDNDA